MRTTAIALLSLVACREDTLDDPAPPSRAPDVTDARGLELFGGGGGDRYERARAQWKLLPRTSARIHAAGPAIAGTVWKPIGPSPIIERGCCASPSVTFAANGRGTSIAYDPSNTDVVYLGASGGGVWKSTDRGDHWTPLTDQEATLGVGGAHAIAVDPTHPGTIYVGSSSFAMLAQSMPRGLETDLARGVLKSTDGGASWIRLGTGTPTGNSGNAAALLNGMNITTILVDPTDSNVVYLAAGRGDDAVPGGVFRSEDGGRNWTAGIGTEAMMVESLVLDPSSPASARVLYAAAWEQGVVKSSDGGRHWTSVLAPGTVSGLGTFHKVMVALAPPNSALPNGPVIYASFMLGDYRTAAIYKNANGGAADAWERQNALVYTHSHDDFAILSGGPFSDLVVDPASPGDGEHDVLYWGGFTQYVSTDAGDRFDEIGQIHGTHGDHQAWLVVPHAGGSIVYAADDGGIFRSEDQGAHWTGTSQTNLATTINAGGLQIATAYQLAVQHDAAATTTLAGVQDSGVLWGKGGPVWTGTSNDGVDVAFAHVATDVAFGIQNAALSKSEDGGTSWSIDFSASIPAAQRVIFKNRVATDPNDPNVLYVGGGAGAIYQSQNAAVPGGTPTFRALSNVTNAFYTSSIAVAPTSSNHVLFAKNNPDWGEVFAGISEVLLSTDALADSPGGLQDLTNDLPQRFVTRVAFDPHDEDMVYATLAGFGSGHVFRKSLVTNKWGPWTDISPALDLPVNAMALDGSTTPATLYIGTDFGVLRRSVADGATWNVVDDLHLPNAAISDLEINEAAGVLRASSWGRGVYELAAPTGPAIFVAQTALTFGQTCAAGNDLPIDITNGGTQNLTIASVARRIGSSQFTVAATPTTPRMLAPAASATFTVHYAPSQPAGAESAIIRTRSDDPTVPSVELVASGRLETTPPTIASVTPSPASLTPPNHKMIPVTVAVSATDSCDADVLASCHIVSVSSNEPVSGTGNGDAYPDWQITGNLTLKLRAERAGSGTGRIYTIGIRCTDNAGNVATASTTVAVPHL